MKQQNNTNYSETFLDICSVIDFTAETFVHLLAFINNFVSGYSSTDIVEESFQTILTKVWDLTK